MFRYLAVLCVVSVLPTLSPAPAAAPDQRVERDLAYGPDPAQRLDLSTPASPDYPTVVFVHGGSLTGGDKADADYGRVCEPFVTEGIACANVNYRLLPGAAWPAPVEDVASAVAWLHRNISSRGGRPDQLFLLGHSSGAMLVALVGANPTYLASHQVTPAIVRGVMPMGSIMWDEDLRRSIEKNGRDRVEAAFSRDPRGKIFGSLDRYESQWPIRHVRAGLPRFLFLIAESEQINPPVLSTNQQFVDDARALGNDAHLIVFPGRNHYGTIRNLHQPGDEVFKAAVGFIQSGNRGIGKR